VLRAAGETETTQEIIQVWLQLDEEDPGFQLVFLQFLNKGSTIIFYIYLFYKFFICLLGLSLRH
jgi:hypothetical protein